MIVPPRNVTCIIPFYNEEPHIRQVLEVVKKVRGISQIIGVDDGSEDNGSAVARKTCPELILVKLSKNQGKANAVKQGLILAKNEFVLLIDADLKDLKEDEITRAVNAIHYCKDIDMIIMRRIRAPWYIKLFRIDTLLSGERILKTNDLKTIFHHPVTGYQLEVAINMFMYMNKKKVCWTKSSAINTFKLEKFSSSKAYSREITMYLSLIRHAGLLMLVKQIFFFCKEKVQQRKAIMDTEIPGPVNI